MTGKKKIKKELIKIKYTYIQLYLRIKVPIYVKKNNSYTFDLKNYIMTERKKVQMKKIIYKKLIKRIYVYICNFYLHLKAPRI